MNIVSAILSALYPGIGQIINREVAKGFFMILLFTTLILMVFYPGAVLGIIGIILIPMIWVWGVVDASHLLMYYPGSAIDTARRRRLMIMLLVGWLVIELIFVLIMWPSPSQEEQQPERLNTFPALESQQSPTDTQTSGTQASETFLTPSENPEPQQTSEVEETNQEDTSVRQPDAAAPTPTVSRAQPASSPYAISLGAFAGPIQADRLRDDAVQQGFATQVIRIRSRDSERLLYNVVVVGFDSMGQAKQACDKLSQSETFRGCYPVKYEKLNRVE